MKRASSYEIAAHVQHKQNSTQIESYKRGDTGVINY